MYHQPTMFEFGPKPSPDIQGIKTGHGAADVDGVLPKPSPDIQGIKTGQSRDSVNDFAKTKPRYSGD